MTKRRNVAVTLDDYERRRSVWDREAVRDLCVERMLYWVGVGLVAVMSNVNVTTLQSVWLYEHCKPHGVIMYC